MATDENSLGGEATFASNAGRPQRPDVSLGDERTIGGGVAVGTDTVFDDIELVDLEARYKFEGPLGEGGMGAVMLATDGRLGRKVAIKRILGAAARSKAAIARFLTEARAIAAINHPNVVQIYELGVTKDGPFLIMEYVDGSSLLDRCRDGALPLEQAVDLACQLCDGLAKAHDLGIVHRDIKPANILLTKDGLPKLTDFGLAKAEATDHQMTMTGAVLGTPDFMPLEQRKDAALVDHRSDLWSLAATLYQMVTGRSPKIIHFKGLTLATQDVLGKALEDKKESRYQSVREFRDALRGIVGGSRARASPSPLGAGGLQEGQCSACSTVNADLGRKFCRNPACGAPLRVPCLKCDTQIPVWDAVCGECGGNQPQLLAAMRIDLETVKATAEANLAECLFDESLRAAEKIATTTLPQLDDLAQWARGFTYRIASERDRRMVGVAEQVKAARAHMAAFDYQAAIQSLELIPGPLLSGEASQVLADCRSLQEESQRLISEIGACIKRKEVDGLLPLVARAVELRGDRKDLQTIYKQLSDRRDAHVAKARAAMELGDARQAATMLGGISTKDCLFTTVPQAVDCESELAAVVQAAKADGQVSVEEARQILEFGERCLQSNPRNEKVRALVQQCNEVILKADVSRSIRLHGVQHIEAARAITRQAISYLNQDKPEQAEPLLKQAMQIVARLDASDGDVKPLEASVLHALGVCYSNQCKHDEAEPLYGRAIVIREKLTGREDPVTARSIRDLAICYHNQGKHWKAESLYEHVATIREKSLGRGHSETETSFRELAVCYQMQGEYAKAESLYERILEIQEMTVGAQESPRYDMTFFELTNCYWQQGKVKEAESLLRRAIRLSDEEVGLEQPWLCRAIYELAHGLAHQGKHVEAEPLYRRALAIEEKALGLEHPDTVVSMRELAVCLARQGKHDEAELLFTKALAAQEKTLGSEHPDTLSCREWLQHCRDVRAMSGLPP